MAWDLPPPAFKKFLLSRTSSSSGMLSPVWSSLALKASVLFLVFLATSCSAHFIPTSGAPFLRRNCLADVIQYPADTGPGTRLERRSGAGTSFSYSGQHNPATWGKSYPTCKLGKHQSPVNFKGGEMLRCAATAAFNFSSHEEAQVINNGHTIQVSPAWPLKEFNSHYLIKGLAFTGRPNADAALPGLFTLQQFHFHVPSEHTIEENGFPLELHFVF